jgi:hypothetical protein
LSEELRLKTTAILFIVIGFALLVVGTVAVVLGVEERLEAARASAAWPTTEGEVVETWMSRSSGVHVRYRYTVAGVDYESDRIRLVEKFWRDQRSDIVARYPEGRRVTVAYDPLDPSSAVLEPGASRGAVTKKLIGPLVLGIAGLGLIWVGVSQVRR